MAGLIRSAAALADLNRRFGGHPLTRGRRVGAMLNLLRYQLAWRVGGEATVHRWIGDSRLIVGRGMTGVTPDVYLGVAEYEDCLFFAHLLRPGDLFVDVGANVGTYTVLAAKVAGADVIAIEPIGATVAGLGDNVRLNDIAARVEVLQLGVSDREGVLRFTCEKDALNRVTDDPAAPTIAVPVRTLDAIVGDRRPMAIKIDVEGHEPRVVAGAERTLAQPTLQALCVETAPEQRSPAFLDSIRRHGFTVHRYLPDERRLVPTEAAGAHNTLFLRDPAAVQARVDAAPRVMVGERLV